MRKLYLSLLLFLTGGLVETKAQIDTEFWFAAPQISAGLGDQPISLRLMSYSSAATVTITQPANGGFTPIVVNLPANTAQSVDLTPFLASIESPSANAVNNNGLYISSTADISAAYEIGASSNKEFLSLKGEKGLGTEFYTPFQKFWNNGTTTPASSNSIEIVATQNATTVLITPRAAITGRAANVTFSVTLNAGQTYSARETDLVATTSLAGSIVSSNKPVAVTIHHGALSNGGCLSTVADQITSSAYIGTDYILHKGTAANERVYILATQNGTSLTITGSSTTTALINWGETYQYINTDTVTYIQSSKPVYVLHVSGFGCKLSGAQVPNLFCAGTYTTAFTRPVADSFAIRLYTRTGFENQFTLNGNASLIPAAAFKNVPGTSGAYKSALIYFNTTDVPVGSHNLVSNTGDIFGLAAFYGSQSAGSGYAYLSEFASYPFVDAGADATICANVPLSLNGVVGGGSVTGTWSSNGFGSFQNGLTSLSNNYQPSDLDTVISPIILVLSSTGPCPVQRDTLVLTVDPAPIINASADQTVCANNAVVALNGSIGGGASGGTWSTLGSGTFGNNSVLNTTYTPSVADTAAGIVQLVLTGTGVGSCAIERDTMQITITSAPTVDAGVATVSVCSNNPLVNVSGTVSGSSTTGRWTTSGNGIFSPNNLSLVGTYTPTVSDINAGTVTLYLESTNNGLCSTAKDSVVVTFTPSPTVDAGVNQIACTNDPMITLNGVVGGPTVTGIWSGGSGTFSPSNTDLNATYTPTAAEITAGNVILTLTTTNNNNCNSVAATTRIDFVSPPFANFNFTNVCLDNATTFTDFSLPGYGTLSNWEWSFGDAQTSTSQNPSHTYTADGTYNVQLIVTNSTGCKDTISQNATVYPIPTADFSYVTTCQGTQVIIDFTDNSSISSGSINFWYYDFGGFGSISSQNASQIFTGTGTFNISHVVASTFGCRDTMVIPITVLPRPNAGFFYNTNNGLNIGAEVNFIDTSSYSTSYWWSFGDGTATSTNQNPDHVYFANGTYYITQVVYDNLGCSDTAVASLTINTVTNEITTLIPNAISPNGDSRNDVWKLEFIGLKYPNASVEVYNRWGQRVFQSDGYTTPWDGTMNGEPLPAGTYLYVIDLKDGSEPFKGTVLLIRN
jgi:gliding motility-associated-like protein